MLKITSYNSHPKSRERELTYEKIQIPRHGDPIQTGTNGALEVPAKPIIPFIEGDGIGIDITPVMRKVVDVAVDKAYGNSRQIQWMEVFAGEKSINV